jgi:hypothetical protein
MTEVAIITASYGGYDSLKEVVPQTISTDWVVVTDNPDLKSAPWRRVYEPQAGVTAFRAAKHAKLYPWEYTDAPVSIWVDGSIKVVSPCFAAEALQWLEVTDPIAEFSSPRRCIVPEAEESILLDKYAQQPVVEQAQHYIDSGHPKDWGMWLTTVIARKHTDQVKRMSAAWEKEMMRWTLQDQVSQPFALRNTGLRPKCFPGNIHSTYWTLYQPSSKHFNNPMENNG